MSLEEAAKIAEHLPIKQVYTDLLKPPIEQVSQIITNVVKTARWCFAPFDYLAAQNDRYQAILKRLAGKIPESNLTTPPPLIVGKTFENLRYREEHELVTEMFINLLAAACDCDRQRFVHPAFPVIIDQLCRDEALILYYTKMEIFTQGMKISSFRLGTA